MPTRKPEPPMYSPAGRIHDNVEPHIDRYGLEMIAGLAASIEYHCPVEASEDDVKAIRRLLNRIVERYAD